MRWIACLLLVLASFARADVLYQNGTIVTDPDAGAGGFDVSRAAVDFDTLGFSVLSPTRLADDFAVNQTWLVENVTVSGYIAGAYSVPPASSPFTGATVSIWRGVPEGGSSQLIATSSAVSGNAFSGIFRVSSGLGNLSNIQRPVFDLTLSFPPTELSPGQYWIDYSLSGSGGNIFSPMVMELVQGQPFTTIGNAQRKLSPAGSWVELFGGTSQRGLDFPFTVSGSIPEPQFFGALGFILLLKRASKLAAKRN